MILIYINSFYKINFIDNENIKFFKKNTDFEYYTLNLLVI